MKRELTILNYLESAVSCLAVGVCSFDIAYNLDSALGLSWSSSFEVAQ